MQGPETRRAVARAARVANDDTLGRLTGLDFQPRVGPLAGKIRTFALLRHHAFEPQFLHRGKKGRAVLDWFAQPEGGIGLDGILEPLAPSKQRLVDDRAPVQVEAVEEVADRRL